MQSDLKKLEFEVCVDSVAGAVAAEQGGAHRIELCANLVEGGTTPSTGMIRAVKQATSLPIMVMVRPRGGHFCFDESEIDTMRAEAEAVLSEEPAGIVIGALFHEGQIDISTTAELIELASGKSVTFHRAFDQVAEPFAALEQLADLGVERILTSGQAASAWSGIERLRRLVEVAEDRVSIMAGAGIRANNIRQLIARTGVHEVHFSGGQLVDRPVAFWRDNVPMSSVTTPGDLRQRVTLSSQVRNICEAALSDLASEDS